MFELAHAAQLFAIDGNELFWPIAGTVAVIAILASTICSALKTRQREMTRREIAAYVAAGSLDKDTALAILKTGQSAEDGEAACA